MAPEFLAGTEIISVETLSGTTIMVTIKRSLSKTVIITAALCPGGSIEVIARIEVRSMETMTR
jgi:hypothetical protein